MTWRSREIAQGWTVSFLLHLIIVLSVVTGLPKLTVLVPRDTFKWEVALVEPSHEVRREEPAPTAATARRPKPSPVAPAAPVESPGETVVARVAPQYSPHMTHPVIEPSKLQPVLVPTPAAAQAPIPPAEPQEAKQPVVREFEPVREAVQHEPVREPVRATASMAEPQTAASGRESTGAAVEHPITESRRESSAAVSPPLPTQPAPVAEHRPVQDVPAPASPPASEAPTQVTKAMPSASVDAAEGKADHRWLAELLWKRVAESQRYPSAARLNGLEGKVVLKAVIRADGQLIEVTVQKSSGHAVLDAAAIETVKLATPLVMPQTLKRPEIVVSLPIVYRLSN